MTPVYNAQYKRQLVNPSRPIPSSLFPFSGLATRWRLDFHLTFLDIVPIRAKCSAATLLETFHHGTLRVIVGIGEYILEKLVQSAVAANVGVIRARFGLL